LSLEDSIFTQLAPPWLVAFTRLALRKNWRRLAAFAMRLPQKRAEYMNAQTRRQLLKYDEELEKSLGFAGVSE
jgi:preprotein translocase subunit SecA